jgi:hypothetical protein
MSVNLSPVGNAAQFLTATGIPLAGGKLYTYQAGSSTPFTTYTDVDGHIANTNPIILNADGRLPAEVWLTAGYSYKFVLKDASDVLIATYDNLYGIIGTIPAVTSIPAGIITLWSGAIGSVPSGWNLCDGTNGTPDLRDRFIVGAGNNYAVAAIGGTADAIVVAHTHTATSVVTDPGHVHGITRASTVAGAGTGDQPWPGNSVFSSSAVTGITVATTNQSTGTSGTGQNLPPYYALAYIQKL